MAFPAFQERLRQLFRRAKFDGGAVIRSTPVVEVVQTWNNPNETFIGKVNNVTSAQAGANSAVERWAVNGSRIAEFRASNNGSLWIGQTAGYIYEYAGGQIAMASVGGHEIILGNAQGGSTAGLLTPSCLHPPYFTDLLLQGGGTYSNSQSGGAVRITGGQNWSGGTNSNGGSVYVEPGVGSGTGNSGVVYLNTSAKTGVFASRLRANGFATATAAKTADYTATLDDSTIEVDASGAARTITLFAASGNAGKILVIKKTDSSANAVTVDGNASETIDGATTISLASQYSTAILQVNAAGTGWNKLSGV